MRPDDVLEHLKKQPFEPIRLFMSDGATFDVQRPDMCIVSRSTLYVGVPDPQRREVADRVVHCALIHVTRIEPLNGRPRRRSTRKPDSH
jgi:hypothetical protein